MYEVPGGIRATRKLDAVSTPVTRPVNEHVLFERSPFEISEAGNGRTVHLRGVEFEGKTRGMPAPGTPVTGGSVPLSL
jgi:hypothetical protein